MNNSYVVTVNVNGNIVCQPSFTEIFTDSDDDICFQFDNSLNKLFAVHWESHTTYFAQAPVVPNTFTPNNDWLNDIFKLVSTGNQDLVEFNIYNRWGQLVYHNTSDPNAGWNVAINGVALDMGVYNYRVVLHNQPGSSLVYKGNITLVR